MHKIPVFLMLCTEATVHLLSLLRAAQDVEVQCELLRCVKASMNNPLGMEWLMENADLVGLVALNLDSPELIVCTLVLELLTVVMVRDAVGHQVVLEAMDALKVRRRPGRRGNRHSEAVIAETRHRSYS
jgi:hypothetical protein